MAKHTTYPPFDADATCPKCGSQSISTNHVPAKDCVLDCTDPEHTYPEHLARMCGRCYFAWREAPLDARREENADGAR